MISVHLALTGRKDGWAGGNRRRPAQTRCRLPCRLLATRTPRRKRSPESERPTTDLRLDVLVDVCRGVRTEVEIEFGSIRPVPTGLGRREIEARLEGGAPLNHDSKAASRMQQPFMHVLFLPWRPSNLPAAQG